MLNVRAPKLLAEHFCTYSFCILVYFYTLCITNGINAGSKGMCFINSDLHCQLLF